MMLLSDDDLDGDDDEQVMDGQKRGEPQPKPAPNGYFNGIDPHLFRHEVGAGGGDSMVARIVTEIREKTKKRVEIIIAFWVREEKYFMVKFNQTLVAEIRVVVSK